MPEVPQPVLDPDGRPVGTVRRALLGRSRAESWEARSLDGCDLGAYPNREEAEQAIRDDWHAGRPRDPQSPGQRFRWQFVDPDATPLYLGGNTP